MNKVDYPVSLLPEIKYISKIDFILLLASNRNIYLIRRSDKSFEQTFALLGDQYVLKSNAIEQNRLSRLSLNLLGSYFKEEHLKYSVHHRTAGGQKWISPEKVKIKKYLNDINQVEVGCPIYLHANNIDGTQIPYLYPYNKETLKNVRDFQKKVIGKILEPVQDPITGNSNFELSGMIRIHHDPLILNYWHVEMLTHSYNNTEIKSESKHSWKDDFFRSVMNNVIKVNAYASVEDVGKFGEDVYVDDKK